MSARLFLSGIVSIEADNDDPCVWVRNGRETVSITFDYPEQIASMRAALDAVEEKLAAMRTVA